MSTATEWSESGIRFNGFYNIDQGKGACVEALAGRPAVAYSEQHSQGDSEAQKPAFVTNRTSLICGSEVVIIDTIRRFD